LENLVFNPSLHSYTFNGYNVPSVSQILLDMGFVNTQWFTDEGRERGSAVHKAIHVMCRGAHCFRSPLIDDYMEAFKKFQKDCDWVPELIEEPMGCSSYAGTPDQIGRFHGFPSVLDWKTGSISSVVGLQLVAYEKLYRINYPVKDVKVPWAMRRFALQLTDTGRYILTEYKDRMDGYIWDSAVSIWNWQKNKGIRKGREVYE
jgi:hypothetical protein